MLLELSREGGEDGGCHQRQQEGRDISLPTGFRGSFGLSPWDTPLDKTGWDVPMLSHVLSARHPQRPTRHPPPRPCTRGHPEAGGSGCCSQPGQLGCTQSPLKGSEMSLQTPRQQIPGRTLGGAASIPSSSPLQDAVAPTWMERGSRAAPTPVVPCSLTRAGGWQPPPRPAPHRWRGQPAQVALCHGRLGPAACGVPGKGCVPATLRSPEQCQGPLMARGVQSPGGPHNAVPSAGSSASAPILQPCTIINRAHGWVTAS